MTKKPKKPRIKKRQITIALVGAMALSGISFYLLNHQNANIVGGTNISESPNSTLDRFVHSSKDPESFVNVSIERMNLLCAEGLAGFEGLAVSQAEEVLQRMASRVELETTRSFRQFQREPQNFENSESYFRMLVLATVLHEDFGVQYNPAKKTKAGEFEPNESFFANSRDVFIHGLLFGTHQGTCSSMPILYIAVGRRLGYPLKLVTAKNHLFVRWEDAKERKNFETTGEGLNSFDDDYYRSWPLPMTPDEEKHQGYLKSLAAKQEFGVFLSIRANCLIAAGKVKEGQETLTKANKLLSVPVSTAPTSNKDINN